MLSNNEHYSHYSLLEKLDDEDREWWSSYTCAVAEDDDWDDEDADAVRKEKEDFNR